MRNFALKFIDIMIGVILGLGFQWWPNLHEPWQYAAFIFVYLDVVDYWIDYSPSLKRFPPKNELDFFFDIAIMFLLFLFIYATQMSIIYFLAVFVIFRAVDTMWLLRARQQYRPVGMDKTFIDTWTKFNIMEAAVTAALVLSAIRFSASALVLLTVFIAFRVITRILASMQYKKVHFA